MVPRRPLAFWQNSAQPVVADGMSFALGRRLGDARLQVSGPKPCAAVYQDCYPSLPLRPGPPRVGSFLSCGDLTPAKFRQSGIFRFSAPVVAIDLSAITTLKRGSSPCTNPLSRFPFSWSLALAMARSTPTVRRLVPSAVPPLALRPTTISRKVPSPVVFLALSPAIKACAADPLTDRFDQRLKAAEARALAAF